MSVGMRAGLTLALLSLTACNVAVPNLAAALTGGPLMRVSYSGGMCRGGGCSSSLAFERDGSYTSTSGQDKPTKGKVPKADIDALAAEIARADFGKIKAVKFTGTCPTAYDGSEVTYTFLTLLGTQEVASCQVAIDKDSPLFKAAAKVVAATQPPAEEEQ